MHNDSEKLSLPNMANVMVTCHFSLQMLPQTMQMNTETRLEWMQGQDSWLPELSDAAQGRSKI
jgi:hypothetical protein